MNKKIISLFVVLSLFFSFPLNIQVNANEETNGFINVMYDNSDTPELLNVIKKDDYLYVNAKSFYTQFGFNVYEKNNKVVIINENNKDLPKLMLSFFYDSLQCDRLTAISGNTYQSPVKPIKNEIGVWVPLNYSLKLLNCESYVNNECIRIHSPRKTILDTLGNFHKNYKDYIFEYSKDYNLNALEEMKMFKTSHLVNLTNGVLSFDTASWLEVLSLPSVSNTLLGNNAYTKKYADNLAILMSTYADEEFEEINKLAQDMAVMINTGEFFNDIDNASVESVNAFFDDMLNGIEAFKNKNLGNYSFSVIGRRVDSIFKNKELFMNQIDSAIGDIGILDITFGIIDWMNYVNTFNEQDTIALNALEETLKVMPSFTKLSKSAKAVMENTVNSLHTNWVAYSFHAFLLKEFPDMILENVVTYVFPPASLINLGWSLVSSFDPVLSETLDATDKIELSKYAVHFQFSSLPVYTKSLEQFNSKNELDSKTLYKMTQYAYSFLKSAYIARESSIAMFENVLSNSDGVSNAYRINRLIAKDLAWLRNATESNSFYEYGLLDADINRLNTEYSELPTNKLFSEVPVSVVIDPFSDKYFAFHQFGPNGNGSYSYHIRLPESLLYGMDGEITFDGPASGGPNDFSIKITSDSSNGYLSNGDKVTVEIIDYMKYVVNNNIGFTRTKRTYTINELGQKINENSILSEADLLKYIDASCEKYIYLPKQDFIIDKVYLQRPTNSSKSEYLNILAYTIHNNEKYYYLFVHKNMSLVNGNLQKHCWLCSESFYAESYNLDNLFNYRDYGFYDYFDYKYIELKIKRQ